MHSGHRGRLKSRYNMIGPSGLSEHEILELILTYAVPRRDVNPLAHRIIDRYGSLEAALKQSAFDLAADTGISLHTATLLSLIGDASINAIFVDGSLKNKRFKNVGEAMELCRGMIGGVPREASCAIMLDKAGFIADHYVQQGEAYSSRFDLKRLISRSLAVGAESVVLAHSHAADVPGHSEADARLTQDIEELLGTVDLRLVEHIIVNGDNCYAMLHNVYLVDEDAEEDRDPFRDTGTE